jgi:hypothetical protein
VVDSLKALDPERPIREADIAAVEYLLADLDPADGETPDAAKARYLDQLNGVFEPKPTAIVDSGNGIQCLWRLTEPVALPAEEEKRKAIIANAEARSAALMVRLGAKPGTQNIDRILRLPGTTNLPTEAKRERGRVECPTKLISFNGTSYSLDAFPLPEQNKPGTPEDGGHRKARRARSSRRQPTSASLCSSLASRSDTTGLRIGCSSMGCPTLGQC